MHNYTYDELEHLRKENKEMKKILKAHSIKYAPIRPKEIYVNLMSTNELAAATLKTWNDLKETRMK